MTGGWDFGEAVSIARRRRTRLACMRGIGCCSRGAGCLRATWWCVAVAAKGRGGKFTWEAFGAGRADDPGGRGGGGAGEERRGALWWRTCAGGVGAEPKLRDGIGLVNDGTGGGAPVEIHPRARRRGARVRDGRNPRRGDRAGGFEDVRIEGCETYENAHGGIYVAAIGPTRRSYPHANIYSRPLHRARQPRRPGHAGREPHGQRHPGDRRGRGGRRTLPATGTGGSAARRRAGRWGSGRRSRTEW